MRRLDVVDVLGRVPAPEVPEGMHLVDVLFKVGPIKGEEPISEWHLDSFEQRRGFQFEPWEAEAIVSMSRAYLGEMHASKEWSAIPPWPPAQRMWKYVQDKIHAPRFHEGLKTDVKEQPSVTRKRHRNSPPG